MDSEEFIIKMDMAGVAISSGSACAARSLEPSYAIEALGFSRKRAKESVRITMGRFTSKNEVDKFLELALKLFKNKSKNESKI